MVDLGYRARAMCAQMGLRLLKSSGYFNGYWDHWRGAFFDRAEAEGIHILPVHYYSPIPARGDRERTPFPNSLTGLDFNIDDAAFRTEAMIERHRDGTRRLLTGLASGEARYDPANTAFHPLDAAVLYGMIMDVRPHRVIEIGSGNSTFVICQAARELKAAGATVDITCIEPYLPAYLRPAPAEITNIIEQPLQDVPLDRFAELGKGDILFIDSTHVVRYGSDVVYEILEILPRLASGVLVHIHDIFLPEDYPARWLNKDRFFWTEQYMLQAFLCMNANFEIVIPAAALRTKLSADVQQMLDQAGSDVYPGSLWIRRV